MSLQERVKRGGHITAEVEMPLEKPVKYLFELKLIGDPNLAQNPAAKISAEIEKHERRYKKQKVFNKISNFNAKTGGWGCGKTTQAAAGEGSKKATKRISITISQDQFSLSPRKSIKP